MSSKVFDTYMFIQFSINLSINSDYSDFNI